MNTAADELTLLRRVVARHIADSYASGVPAAEHLARSLETEIDTAGLSLVPELRAAERAVVTSLIHRRSA